MSEKLSFACDYMRGAHPDILKRLIDTNMMKTAGYGFDAFSESAAEKIRAACECENALVKFLVGGTQANAVVIDAFLRSWQGVIAAKTGHISIHEAGAIEANGHKVIELPHTNGKLDPEDVRKFLTEFYLDETHDHMVQPGMVYISHPTEYGTLYSLAELEELHRICADFQIPLFMDGARLAYALACPENELTLPDIARFCDAFYIGGTKCGALFGEAVVVRDPERVPHLFTIIKQHGALLAKGRLAGIQFDELFTNGLYQRIGIPAIRAAERIRKALDEKGYVQCFGSPTNQIFFIMDNEKLSDFSQKVEYSFWEIYDREHTIIRLATDWAASDEETDALIGVL